MAIRKIIIDGEEYRVTPNKVRLDGNNYNYIFVLKLNLKRKKQKKINKLEKLQNCN